MQWTTLTLQTAAQGLQLCNIAGPCINCKAAPMQDFPMSMTLTSSVASLAATNMRRPVLVQEGCSTFLLAGGVQSLEADCVA